MTGSDDDDTREMIADMKRDLQALEEKMARKDRAKEEAAAAAAASTPASTQQAKPAQAFPVKSAPPAPVQQQGVFPQGLQQQKTQFVPPEQQVPQPQQAGFLYPPMPYGGFPGYNYPPYTGGFPMQPGMPVMPQGMQGVLPPNPMQMQTVVPAAAAQPTQAKRIPLPPEGGKKASKAQGGKFDMQGDPRSATSPGGRDSRDRGVEPHSRDRGGRDGKEKGRVRERDSDRARGDRGEGAMQAMTITESGGENVVLECGGARGRYNTGTGWKSFTQTAFMRDNSGPFLDFEELDSSLGIRERDVDALREFFTRGGVRFTWGRGPDAPVAASNPTPPSAKPPVRDAAPAANACPPADAVAALLDGGLMGTAKRVWSSRNMLVKAMAMTPGTTNQETTLEDLGRTKHGLLVKVSKGSAYACGFIQKVTHISGGTGKRKVAVVVSFAENSVEIIPLAKVSNTAPEAGDIQPAVLPLLVEASKEYPPGIPVPALTVLSVAPQAPPQPVSQPTQEKTAQPAAPAPVQRGLEKPTAPPLAAVAQGSAQVTPSAPAGTAAPPAPTAPVAAGMACQAAGRHPSPADAPKDQEAKAPKAGDLVLLKGLAGSSRQFNGSQARITVVKGERISVCLLGTGMAKVVKPANYEMLPSSKDPVVVNGYPRERKAYIAMSLIQLKTIVGASLSDAELDDLDQAELAEAVADGFGIAELD